MKRFPLALLFTSVLLGVLIIGFQANAEDLSQTGRDLLSKNQNALVTMEVSLKVQMGSGADAYSNEGKFEITGVVLDSSGLVVASLTSLNPAEMAMAQADSSDPNKPNVKSDITALKIRLADGTLIPAKVVIRDKDLDLAFIRPVNAPAKPFEFIDASQSGTAKILDNVFLIDRLESNLNRVAGIWICHISAICDKPRTFYVADGNAASDLGGVVFTADGKPLGMMTLRSKKDSIGPHMDSVILPFADILAASKQASPVAAATK